MILEGCDISQHDLTSLKVCYTGGERIPISLLWEYQKRNITISQIFGLTETSTVTWLGKEDAVRKMGSVGRPVLHGEMRIVKENGDDIRPGEVGEIIVGGTHHHGRLLEYPPADRRDDKKRMALYGRSGDHR